MTRLLLTVPEAAEALAISRSKLYELLRQRRHRLDPHRRITPHPAHRPGRVHLQAAHRKDRRVMPDNRPPNLTAIRRRARVLPSSAMAS